MNFDLLVRRLPVLAAAAIATMLAGSPVCAQQSLKIGGIGSLTGAASVWGLANQRGIQLAIDEIVAQGGLKVGGVTYKPELTMYDDAYTGQGGKTAMERLLYQDKASFIIGPLASPPVLGAVAALDEARTNNNVTALEMHVGAALDILKNRYGAPYNFLIADTNREYAPAMVKWLKAQYPTMKRVGIIAPNDAVGQVVVPVLVEAYKAEGIEVWFEMFERGTKEFTPLLTRMIGAGVDALDLNNNAPGDAALLFRQARQGGFRGMVMQTGGPAVDDVIGAVGSLSDGFLSFDLYDFTAEKAKPLVSAYEQKYGQGTISGFMPIMYNATKFLFAAMQRADSIDPTKVREALEAMNGFDTGVFGPMKWTGKETYGVNHLLALPFLIVEVKDGKASTRAVVTP